MKIKLLNDGGYVGMELIKFPVEVDSEFNESHDFVGHYRVNISDLRDLGYKGTDKYDKWLAWLPEEVEVLK